MNLSLTVLANAISDLVASEIMCLSVIVVKLIRKTVKEAVIVRVHADDVVTIREK